jgi:hypothetical protein
VACKAENLLLVFELVFGFIIGDIVMRAGTIEECDVRPAQVYVT